MEKDIRDKFSRVQLLVDTANRTNQAACTEVLREFHSACDPLESSCAQANQQSFQVTTEQVCDAVNTKVKLKFEAIADEFDSVVDGTSQRELCVANSAGGAIFL